MRIPVRTATATRGRLQKRNERIPYDRRERDLRRIITTIVGIRRRDPIIPIDLAPGTGSQSSYDGHDISLYQFFLLYISFCLLVIIRGMNALTWLVNFASYIRRSHSGKLTQFESSVFFVTLYLTRFCSAILVVTHMRFPYFVNGARYLFGSEYMPYCVTLAGALIFQKSRYRWETNYGEEIMGHPFKEFIFRCLINGHFLHFAFDYITRHRIAANM